MTLQEILEAIDQLTVDEVKQLKTYVVEREASLGSEPQDTDLESMAGLFKANVTDLSVNARRYLREIIQNKHDRTD
jgi:hypothetical protein